MIVCPACGSETPDDASECARCHLSTGLFVAVREAAAQQEDNDPRYVQTIGEILSQLGDEALAPVPTPSEARIIHPHRFPTTPSATPPAEPLAEPKPVGTLPALPAGGEVPALTRQVEDLLQVARRQGIDLAKFHDRTQEAMLAQDRATLEQLNRDLFVTLAAALTDEYETGIARRNELAGLIPVSSVDVELESARQALALGDLPGAQRRLRHIEELVSHIEEEWATVQILVTEADLLTATIRELGGDPRPGLGPLAEGQRRAREGNREGAEPVLARATLALWTILNPLFQRDLARLREILLDRRARSAPLGDSVRLLRDLATDLRHRNFASAILSYRGLRDALAPGPDTVPGGSPSPAPG